MPSDPKRVEQVFTHIGFIRDGTYPRVVEVNDARRGQYVIQDRPWAEIPEPAKLAILQDAVNWEGITEKDRANILLASVDPGQLEPLDRQLLIRMAVYGTALLPESPQQPPPAPAKKKGR